MLSWGIWNWWRGLGTGKLAALGTPFGGDAPRPLRLRSGNPASGDRSLDGEGWTTPAEAASSSAAQSCPGSGRLRPREPKAEGAVTGHPAATAAARPRLLRLRRPPGGVSAVPASKLPFPAPRAPFSAPARRPGAPAALTRRPVPRSAPRRLLHGGGSASPVRRPRSRRRSPPASAIFPPPLPSRSSSSRPPPARGLFRKVFIFRLSSWRKKLPAPRQQNFSATAPPAPALGCPAPRPLARPAER